ncbi:MULTISPECIES: putative holin-like toxin [Zhenhengia]|nr:putative holin-like toxin [Zhenhengia yiwuensis]MBU3811344.1 putative holin-like toxin [Candidatus Niameybacter stercoravium]MDU6853138.1 putative holin-like toxin [Clostridiales bacterium]MDU6972728.1 putative holin-like toxin [Clostridiales bacterium]MDY3368136.1 putative holin-like toxin [Zhenhengia yiwuensis]
MSNDDLMLLFNAGSFLLTLLTFIVLLIEKITKK